MTYPVHPQPSEPSQPSGRFEPGGGAAADGRIARGMELLGRSWRYLRAYPRLFALPAMAAVATAIAALLIFAPVLVLTGDWDPRVSVFAAGAASALPFVFVSTFFNVGFLGMVAAYQRSEAPTVRDGLRFARERWRVIAVWSLISAVVGTLLSALQQLPVVGEWLGRLIGFLGGLAWALASFFVVPVIVVEGLGARAALRRSVSIFRARWGEAVTGDLVIGAAAGLAILPFVFIGMAGFAMYPDTLGVVLLAVAVVGFGATIALSSAVVQFFQLALYEHAVAGSVPAPFTEQDMRGAVKERGRRFWHR